MGFCLSRPWFSVQDRGPVCSGPWFSVCSGPWSSVYAGCQRGPPRGVCSQRARQLRPALRLPEQSQSVWRRIQLRPRRQGHVHHAARRRQPRPRRPHAVQRARLVTPPLNPPLPSRARPEYAFPASNRATPVPNAQCVAPSWSRHPHPSAALPIPSPRTSNHILWQHYRLYSEKNTWSRCIEN